MYSLYFDGLYRRLAEFEESLGNVGFMCYGWLIEKDRVQVARGHGASGRKKNASSYVAEYLALIEGLEALRDMGIQKESIHIVGDAKTVIDQMLGLAEVRSGSVRPLHRKAQQLAWKFRDLSWQWVPRRYNHSADRLTRHALQQMQATPEFFQEAMRALEHHALSKRRSNDPLPLLDLWVFQPAGSSS